ncbi:MAG: thiamine phosphate synthase [Cohaesibacter sp.]|nr:thiamine phosphate synthase [Cohaesibacter sp.]MCV6600594.1 thiamine phosphate synthase [Cohaesibacter sp.]
MQSTQIYLITPKQIDLDTFPALLSEALAGGEIAALLIDCDAEHDSELQKIAQTLTSMAQAKDVAVLLRGDSRIAGRAKCDGLHLDGDLDAIREGAEDFSNRFMTGAEGSNKRHEAMQRGESGIDYIMFGRLNAPEEEMIYPQSFEMADWWSSLFEVPAVILSGTSLDGCEQAAKAGIEFIALRSAVWNHAQGPRLAIQQANSLLAEHSIESA